MQIDAGLWWFAYLAWVGAGLCDFLCHRYTDLPHTSGIAESSLHLAQLVMIGAALLAALVFETGRLVALGTLMLVLAHAIVGYLDTRSAFGRRTILPVEQHLHSVLDMAPLIGWCCLMAVNWPSIVVADWDLTVRHPALDLRLWGIVMLPALALCVLPALLEFRAAWSARASMARRNG